MRMRPTAEYDVPFRVLLSYTRHSNILRGGIRLLRCGGRGTRCSHASLAPLGAAMVPRVPLIALAGTMRASYIRGDVVSRGAESWRRDARVLLGAFAALDLLPSPAPGYSLRKERFLLVDVGSSGGEAR